MPANRRRGTGQIPPLGAEVRRQDARRLSPQRLMPERWRLSPPQVRLERCGGNVCHSCFYLPLVAIGAQGELAPAMALGGRMARLLCLLRVRAVGRWTIQ